MKNFLLIILSISVISCNKEINCSGTDEQKVLFDILSSEFESNYLELKSKNDLNVIFDLSYEEVKSDFFSEAIKLEGMRPSKVEKELKKCDCDAQITAQIPPDMINYLEKNTTEFYTFEFELIKKPKTIENIKYSLQLTEDSQIYCETVNKGILLQFFIDYSYFKNIINNHKNGLLKSNAENSASNDSALEESKTDNLTSIEIGKYCNIIADINYPVYFYKTPDENNRKSAKFTTNEKVYIDNVSNNNFAFITFTNENNQTSSGWIRFQDLKPIEE